MKSIRLKINNSAKAAIKTGKWSNPGASYYNKLINAFDSRYQTDDGHNVFPEPEEAEKWNYWKDFLKEGYLIAPVEDITFDPPETITPYSNSGCKYPHHVIKDGELVVSIPGLKAAYNRACQMGEFKGEVKEHIVRHIKELDIQDQFHFESWDIINKNFDDIISYLGEKFDVLAEAVEEDKKSEEAMEDTKKRDEKDKEYVPIFGIIKSYSDSVLRADGTPKSQSELASIKFKHQIKTLTRGDNYSHAVVSFDDSFEKMYSFDDEGFVVDNIMKEDSWLGTDSIYICVMFVTKAERDRSKKFVQYLIDHKNETKYAYSNLLKAYIGKPVKNDKRFVCSTFTSYILQCSNPKNLHRDYSRMRPEDITILPRAFYVMNVSDRLDFIKKREQLQKRVKEIFEDYKEEIEDYNNYLPKIMLKDRMDKLKTFDKILDWIINKL